MRGEDLLREFARIAAFRLRVHPQRRRNQIAAEDDAQILRLQLAQHVGNQPARVPAGLGSRGDGKRVDQEEQERPSYARASQCY